MYSDPNCQTRAVALSLSLSLSPSRSEHQGHLSIYEPNLHSNDSGRPMRYVMLLSMLWLEYINC